MIPATEPLIGSNAEPTWVRILFRDRGLFNNARSRSRTVFQTAAKFTSSIPISQPTISGRTFVMDFRVKRTITAGRLVDEFIRRYGLDVVTIDRVQRRNLQKAQAPATRREEVVQEAEQSRVATQRARRANVFGKIVDTAKFVRGIVVLAVVGGVLVAGFPAIKAGAAVLAKRVSNG